MTKYDINEINRRLEAGEKVKLECIDRASFLNVNEGNVIDENIEILESGLVVYRVSRSTIFLLDCPHPIMIDEIQYFKIKEQDPTFDDLIDVAIQAKKDGVIYSVDWDSSLTVKVDSDRAPIVVACEKVSVDFIEDAIRSIESCYTETFTIESENDISRVKTGADIELANGNKCTFLNNDGMWHIKDDKGFIHNCGLLVLKSATVTQRKKTNN